MNKKEEEAHQSMVNNIIFLLSLIRGQVYLENNDSEELIKIDKYITEMKLLEENYSIYDNEKYTSIQNYIITQKYINFDYESLETLKIFRDFHEDKTPLRTMSLILTGITNKQYQYILGLQNEKSYYYELNSILNDDSFQEMIYDVMSSKIVSNYYTIKEQKEEDNYSQIINEHIIKGYKELLVILKEKSFFEDTVCLINLPKNMKCITTRYLIIAINYTHITIDKLQLKCLPIQEQYKSIIQLIPNKLRAFKDDNSESNVIKVNVN